MTLFLVTKSEHYYPREAAGDWLLVTADEGQAREAFATTTLDHYESVHLIRLSEGEWEVYDSRSG